MNASPADLGTLALDGRVESAPPSPHLLGVRCVAEWNPVADPAWQRILNEIAGLNLFSGPNLRILSGAQRLELVGGLWTNNEEEDAGLPAFRCQWTQRYPWFEEFWIVEEWKPPLFYGTRSSWERGQRQHEDGVTYLEHPIYPERGDYEYLNHFRRKTSEGLEIPETPSTTGLRMLAHLWVNAKNLKPPSLWEAQRRLAEKRARKAGENKRVKRDIWENEVGGLSGFKPIVSLAGLDVPSAE